MATTTADASTVSNDLLTILLDAAFPEGSEIISGFLNFIEDLSGGGGQLAQIATQISNLQNYVMNLPMQTANAVHYTGALHDATFAVNTGLANLNVDNYVLVPGSPAPQQLLTALSQLGDSEYQSLNSILYRASTTYTSNYYSLINNVVSYAYNTYITSLNSTPLGIGNCYANDLYTNTPQPSNNNGYVTANIYDLVTPHILLATTVSGVAALVCKYASQVYAVLQIAMQNNLFSSSVNTDTIAAIGLNLKDVNVVNDLVPVNNSIPFYNTLNNYLSCNAAPKGICGNAFTLFNEICAGTSVTILNYRTDKGDNYLASNGSGLDVKYVATPTNWWATFCGMNTSTFATLSTVNLVNNDLFLTAVRSGNVSMLQTCPQNIENGIQAFTLLAQCSTPQSNSPYTYEFLLQCLGEAVVNNISWGDYSPGFFSIDVTDADQWWIIQTD